MDQIIKCTGNLESIPTLVSNSKKELCISKYEYLCYNFRASSPKLFSKDYLDPSIDSWEKAYPDLAKVLYDFYKSAGTRHPNGSYTPPSLKILFVPFAPNLVYVHLEVMRDLHSFLFKIGQ
jgi:hypothetical protein